MLVRAFSREAGAALHVQHFLRSTFEGSPPHLVGQLLRVVRSINLIVRLQDKHKAAAATFTLFEAFEAAEDTIQVAREMYTYLLAKRAATSSKLSFSATRELMSSTRGSGKETLTSSIEAKASQLAAKAPSKNTQSYSNKDRRKRSRSPRYRSRSR